MLSKKEKESVIKEMRRNERYRKVEAGILGLSQYKPTDEDLIFLIKEHKDLTTENAELKEAQEHPDNLVCRLAEKNRIMKAIVEAWFNAELWQNEEKRAEKITESAIIEAKVNLLKKA